MDEPEFPDDEIEVVYLDEDEEVEELADEMDEIDDETDKDEGLELEVIDVSKLTFSKHQKPVFAGALSSDNQLAITGGQDDMAYVWSTTTGEVVMECTGHKDSVTEVAFNWNNQYVATGDMSGLIQVWSLKDRKLVWCYEVDDLNWLQWHGLANVLVAGSHSGDIFVWQIPQGNCKVLASQGSPTTCGKILPDGKQIIAGYTDNYKLWDMKSASTVWQMSDPQITVINSLDVNSDGTLAVFAPNGKIIKTLDGKIIGTVLVQGETETEVAVFNSELGVLATGSLTGQLCVWEMGRQSIRHQAKIDAAVTVMKWGLSGRLFVGATDGAIYVCNAKSGTLIETLTGHKADILSVSLSKDGAFIMTTSDDCTAKIFTLKSE